MEFVLFLDLRRVLKVPWGKREERICFTDGRLSHIEADVGRDIQGLAYNVGSRHLDL